MKHMDAPGVCHGQNGANDVGPLTIAPAALLRAWPHPAVLIGPSGTVIAFNDAAESLLGLRALDVGRPTHEVQVLQSGPAVREALQRAREEGVTTRVPDADVVTAVGARRVAFTAAAVGGTSSARWPVLVTVDEVNASAAVPPADAPTASSVLDTARRENQATVQFVTMLAHELRNPLGAIVNALYLLRPRVQGDRAAERVLLIATRQASEQARLLDDLLDSSRLGLGKIQLHFERVDLAQLVREAVEVSRLEMQARAHSLTLHDAGEILTVRGDRGRLVQVVRNLLGNAVKYTPPGGVIDVVTQRDGPHAVLRIRDTGVGIAPDVLPRVFDLFSQGDVGASEADSGLGVGLSLVRALVDLHGGSVEARSPGPGQGSEFVVSFALDMASAPARPADEAAPGEHARGPARRVLVVEDNRDARELMRMVLETDGHTVDVAADGETAVRLAGAAAPDVVLVDIGLPGIDGYEVARRIRRRLGRAVRLIALTGYGDRDARQHTAEAGFDAHMVKPITPEELDRLLAS